MSDLSLWASRYQFTQELWRDAARLVLDPGLERALSHGEPDGVAVRELLAELLPAGSGRAASGTPAVWMGMERSRRAAEYARRFGGVVFAGVADLPELAADEAWQSALVDLGGLLEASPHADAMRLEARVSPALAATLETLAERAEEGRTVVISAPAREQAGPRGISLDSFVEYISAYFEDAKLYALAPAPMAGVYELADEGGEGDEGDEGDAFDGSELDEPDTEVYPVRAARGRPTPAGRDYNDELDDYDAQLDAAEATWAQGRGPDLRVQATQDGGVSQGESADIPIALDTTLGAEEPQFFSYLAVIGGRARTPEGVTYVELPGASFGTAQDSDRRQGESERGPDAAGLRAQLAQAQRQAELLALDKQRLLEELEDAQDQLDSFDEEGVSPASVSPRDDQDGRARLDAALAQAQELRWRVRELEGRNAELLARPVQELEAENAALAARLARATAPRATAPVAGPDTSDGEPAQDLPSSTWLAELIGRVDKLIRRVERGGMPALELHANLRRLRERLTRRR